MYKIERKKSKKKVRKTPTSVAGNRFFSKTYTDNQEKELLEFFISSKQKKRTVLARDKSMIIVIRDLKFNSFVRVIMNI